MPPIISCMANSYGSYGPQAAIERLCSAGIQYLELPIRTQGVMSIFRETPLLTHRSTPADIASLEKLLAQHDVQLASCNLTGGNPLDEETVSLLKKKLDVAHALGVTVVVGGAGEVQDESQLPELYGHLKEIGDYAGNLGITYCFETHPGLCESHYAMLETMQVLDHPQLRLNFDTANILYYNRHVEGEIALAKVCQFVKHLHLKDSLGEYRSWYFPALGEGGAVNFIRVLEIMRACGFAGPYSIEIEGIHGEAEPSLDEYHRRIVNSAQHLRDCGFFDP